MTHNAISLLLNGDSIDDVIASLLEMTVNPTRGIIRGANQYNWKNIKRGAKRLSQHLPRKVVRPKNLLRGAAAFANA